MEKRSSPPKKLKIKGQPHKLAYINDVEEGLLRARGGSGEMVHGIPAFYSDADDAFAGAAMSDFQSDYGGGHNDGDEYAKTPNIDVLMAGAAARNRIDAANKARIEAARRSPTVQQVYDDTNYGQATKAQIDELARSYFNSLGTNGLNVFAPSVFSSKRIGGSVQNAIKNRNFGDLLGVPSYSTFFDDPDTRKAVSSMAMDSLQNRLDSYKDSDNYFDEGVNSVRSYFGSQIMDDLKNGGRPAFDKFGNVQGSFSKNALGLEVYTGNPIEGMPETGFYERDPAQADDAVFENPLTGEKQCPDGYFFDEDLQACRMGAPEAGDDQSSTTAPQDGLYYRPTGLESAPAFAPTGFDYDALNKAYLESYAYRPENYQDQMNLTGFKKIT